MELTLGISLFGQLRCQFKLAKHVSYHQSYREAIVGVVRSQRNGNDASGDPDMQQKLVDIIRLETGKVRVSDYIQERANLLSDIAEQAIVESDQIAREAMKGFDEASAKTIKAIDESFQAVEDQLASDLAELSLQETELDDFEKSVQDARSEGLFFKALYKPSKSWKDRDPSERKAIKEAAKQVAETARVTLKSKSRKNLYMFLLLLMGFVLAESLLSDEHSLSSTIVYTVIILFLLIQLFYEESLSPKRDDTE
ncbi:hypothetical protein KP509_15G054400 [Ceratopteris richardii]|uniref:Uncharacterized protein n=1 Tax=Ceratopteris richardii TaxID=49495 RepID=A0A8T2T8C3_CERRI|nr:hypothetical protein KP509_15G054400 [Ceratopteris richardii]